MMRCDIHVFKCSLACTRVITTRMTLAMPTTTIYYSERVMNA